MKKLLLAGVAVLAIAGSTAVYAQHRGHDGFRHHHMRMNPEDRAAFFDARIAAVKAGLKLNPDQDKLWPPLEAAVRDFVKLRIDRANARMQEKQARVSRDDRGSDARSERDGAPVLICPHPVATARSAIVVSSVSPERWLIMHRYPDECASVTASRVSDSVPIWLTFTSSAFAAPRVMPSSSRSGLVTNRSSPTICTFVPSWEVSAIQPSQSSS